MRMVFGEDKHCGHSAKDYECSEAAEKEKKQQSELRFKKERKENLAWNWRFREDIGKNQCGTDRAKGSIYTHTTHN